QPWVSALIQSNPGLYRLIYDWNLYPHRWALPERLNPNRLPESLVAVLEKSPRGRNRLSSHHRANLNLDQTFWDFELPRRRIALLPAASLARLASFAGAAWNAPTLARIVSQKAYLELASIIGADAYAYALHRGRSLVAAAGLLLPAVRESPAATVTHSGWNMLATVLDGEDPALINRFRLKTPVAVSLGPVGRSELSPFQAWTFLQPIMAEQLPLEDNRCFA
ncbi:MAG: hypothetical protein RIQ93_3139, partial [Verrucomicrobiota bacterium]